MKEIELELGGINPLLLNSELQSALILNPKDLLANALVLAMETITELRQEIKDLQPEYTKPEIGDTVRVLEKSWEGLIGTLLWFDPQIDRCTIEVEHPRRGAVKYGTFYSRVRLVEGE